MLHIAIFDDYQNVALASADWSSLAGKAGGLFNDHLFEANEIAMSLTEAER
jgi:hypothetical protein